MGAGAGLVLGSAGGAAAGYGLECASRRFLGRELLGFDAEVGAAHGAVAGIGFGFGKGVLSVMQTQTAEVNGNYSNHTEL